MANTPRSYKTAIVTGSSEPVVDVVWDNVSDAVDSFVKMCEASDIPLGQAELRLILILYMGGFENNVFQLISRDNSTVVSIQKVTVGIPTPTKG